MKGLLFDGVSELLAPAKKQEQQGRGACASQCSCQSAGGDGKRTCQNSKRSFFRRLRVWLMEIIVLMRCGEGSERHPHTSQQRVQEGRMMPKSA